MKQFVTLLIIILCSSMACSAQTYLDHLKQKNPGQGTVTVNQSKAIDELVNGKPISPQDDKTKTQPQNKNITPVNKNGEYMRKDITAQHKDATAVQHKDANNAQHKETNNAQHKLTSDSLKKNEQQKAASNATHENNAAKAEPKKEEPEIPVVDMRKKVMRKSYKVTGYRVQVYAGGNSRNDRLKAEQTGNNIKMNFPDQPVYVHFYSPRWICRMGNFRSLGEAQKMLSKVKSMGYKQACLVKGQITVQY